MASWPSIYFVENIAYTFKLKQVAFLDVGLIASGFVLRVLAGGFATDVHVSGYMIACTALLALFLGFGKRRHELELDTAGKQRAALEAYSQPSLNVALALTGVATAATYVAYTLDPTTRAFFHTELLWLTAPFTLFGIVRFLMLVSGRAGRGFGPSRRRRRCCATCPSCSTSSLGHRRRRHRLSASTRLNDGKVGWRRAVGGLTMAWQVLLLKLPDALGSLSRRCRRIMSRPRSGEPEHVARHIEAAGGKRDVRHAEAMGASRRACGATTSSSRPSSVGLDGRSIASLLERARLRRSVSARWRARAGPRRIGRRLRNRRGA